MEQETASEPHRPIAGRPLPKNRSRASTIRSALFLVVMYQVGMDIGAYSGATLWVAVGGLAFFSAAVVIGFEYWKYWLVRPLPSRTTRVLLIELFACFAMLTSFISILLAALYQAHVVGAKGNLNLTSAFQAGNLACLWHFLDLVPVLKVPETLNWKLTHPFTGLSAGLLMLVYELLVAIPVIAVGTELVGRARGARAKP
jgi:hypothetical protein